MGKYKIAGVCFGVETAYKETERYLSEYAVGEGENPVFFIEVTKSDMSSERDSGFNYPDWYFESLVIFRKLCEYLVENCNGIIFHSSAVAVDGEAYLFTAPSGTGKSTHARLWRKLLGDKAVMINDDKPIIRYVDGDFYVYGTPWNGKHRLSVNTRARVKALCHLTRAKDNSIERITPAEMLPVVLNQTLRFDSEKMMDKLFSVIDKMLKTVSLYRLKCNTEDGAAKISYEFMRGGK